MTHHIEPEHSQLHGDLVRILYRHDPIGIGAAMNGPLDEYEPEAQSILPQLRGVSTAEALSVILREVFIYWFDEGLAGPVETYVPIAEEILAAVRRQAKFDTGQAGR